MSSRIRQSFLPGDYKSTTKKYLGGKMKKFVGFMLIAFFVATGALFVMPIQSEAVPAFARQTGQGCTSCHFQRIPLKNAFAREFQAGGFTMVGGQSLISGDMLSIPAVLNASMLVKVRYQKSTGSNKSSGTNKGELQFADEAALLVGGRVGENIGFLAELQMVDGGAPTFSGFRLPFVFDLSGTKVGIVPYTTDGLGASYGFELLNTGAQRNIRPMEHRGQSSAIQYVGTATPATGFAFYAYRDIGYINFSLWNPSAPSDNPAIGPMSKYFRIAATPQVGDWDLGVGLQWWGGTSGMNTARNQTHAWAIDGQAQGHVGKMPLGVYASYGSAAKSKAGQPTNLFNSGTANNKTALSIAAELGVIPHHASVGLAYRMGKKNSSSNRNDDAFTLAGIYEVAQNVELVINHTILSGSANSNPSDGKNLTTLMIETAF